MRAYVTTAASLTVALLGGTLYMAYYKGSGTDYSQCVEGSVATGAASIGGPFELVNEAGVTVTNADVITKPTLVYFGYTFCPDVCPLDAYRNGEAADLLAAQGIDVGTVFISIDPARDTPEILVEYTDAMHPDMVGLTGSPAQVKSASQAYKAFYDVQPTNDDFYLINHSTFTYLMFPEVGFVDFFRREATVQQIADRVSCFVDAVQGRV